VLVVTGRSSNRIDTFLVGKDGLLMDGRFAFVANAASASVSMFSVSPTGELTFLGATTIPGMTPLDLDISKDGKHLYVLAAGSHGIVEFDVGHDGSLTFIGAMLSIPATAAGIAVR
jgi:6-phosphogluconolactonase